MPGTWPTPGARSAVFAALDLQPDAYREALVRRGGTSLGTPWECSACCSSSMFAIGIVTEVVSEMGAAN